MFVATGRRNLYLHIKSEKSLLYTMDSNTVAQTLFAMTSFCSSVMQAFFTTLWTLQREQERRRRLDFRAMVQRRRRLRARKQIFLFLTLLASKPRKPRLRMRPVSEHWWEHTIPLFDDRDWLENFRVRKGTFQWICSQVHDILKPQPNLVQKNYGMSTEKTVAIALFKLSRTAEYLVVANLFRVCKATVHNCLYSFCFALLFELQDKYLKFPIAEETEHIATCFEERTNIPQLIGAIDGSHIPDTRPREGSSDFICRKNYPSVILQAVVDHQYIFRDVSCKLPGSCHDRDALHESSLYKDSEKIMPKGFKILDGKGIQFMLMGDPAYPLEPWLIKNYSYDKNISPQMDSFNVYLNKGRVVVEDAFGRLKSRWRILARQSVVNYKHVPTMVAACCILHNICEISKESVSDQWLKVHEEDERLYPQPDTEVYDLGNMYDAEDMRDHLMIYLTHKCTLLTSSRARVALS